MNYEPKSVHAGLGLFVSGEWAPKGLDGFFQLALPAIPGDAGNPVDVADLGDGVHHEMDQGNGVEFFRGGKMTSLGLGLRSGVWG